MKLIGLVCGFLTPPLPLPLDGRGVFGMFLQSAVLTPPLPFRHPSPRRGGELRFPELFEVGDFAEVLVAVVEVFSSHTPDEGIVVSGGSAVYAPFR